MEVIKMVEKTKSRFNKSYDRVIGELGEFTCDNCSKIVLHQNFVYLCQHCGQNVCLNCCLTHMCIPRVINAIATNLVDWEGYIHPERLLEMMLLGMSVEDFQEVFVDNHCYVEPYHFDYLADITIGVALLNLPEICREPGCNEPVAEDVYGNKFIKCEKHRAENVQRFIDWFDRKSMELSGDLEKWK